MATSAQAISRILNKAGIRKSETGATRISGYHVTTEGYEVTQNSTHIFINYTTGNWERADEIQRKELAKIQIPEILAAKGYVVQECKTWNTLFVLPKVGAYREPKV